LLFPVKHHKEVSEINGDEDEDELIVMVSSENNLERTERATPAAE